MSLKVYFDEHVDVDLAPILRRNGFDVLTTQEAHRANQEISDEDQLAFAAVHGRAILTHNIRDYMPLALEWAAQGRHHSGIIVCPRRALLVLARGFASLTDMYPNGLDDLCVGLPLP